MIRSGRLARSELPREHAALLGKLSECVQACELAIASLDRPGSHSIATVRVSERLCDDCRRHCLAVPRPAAWAFAQGCARATRACREFRSSVPAPRTAGRSAAAAPADIGRRPVGYDLRGAPIAAEAPPGAGPARRAA